jgi:hypothetical protein
MKPQITPVAEPGAAGPWMCATVRLSFESGVCDPVKSILKTVAVHDMDVMASLISKVALPNEAGRGSPVEVVGTTSATS